MCSGRRDLTVKSGEKSRKWDEMTGRANEVDKETERKERVTLPAVLHRHLCETLLVVPMGKETRLMMRIWIDLSNSPHPLLFAPGRHG